MINSNVHLQIQMLSYKYENPGQSLVKFKIKNTLKGNN